MGERGRGEGKPRTLGLGCKLANSADTTKGRRRVGRRQRRRESVSGDSRVLRKTLLKQAWRQGWRAIC